MFLLISLTIVGWVAASVLGTQAYFRGEQTKAIHPRNSQSQSFAELAAIIAGQGTDLSRQTVADRAKS
ncbi:MAG: photosystem II protein, Psb35-related [Thermosynechococcaceae cyanobacterium]